MSHNVLGLRRLGQVIGQCEALTPAPNVLEQNRTKGVSPTAVLRKPSPRRGRSVNRLLHAVCSYTINNNKCCTSFALLPNELGGIAAIR